MAIEMWDRKVSWNILWGPIVKSVHSAMLNTALGSDLIAFAKWGEGPRSSEIASSLSVRTVEAYSWRLGCSIRHAPVIKDCKYALISQQFRIRRT